MTPEALLSNQTFLEFVRRVEEELERLRPNQAHRQQALHSEQVELEQRRAGWIQSLGNPNLSPAIRGELEKQFETAESRLQQIESQLGQLAATLEGERQAVDPSVVADRLNQLDDVLGTANASATNLILAQHIDGIYCDRDGRVVVRTCRLGCLAGAMDLMPRDSANEQVESSPDSSVAKPRRRTRRNTGNAIDDDEVAAAANDFAVDPERFGGLGPEWFHEDVFEVPRRLSWAEENAQKVAEYRLSTNATMEATARHFGKTPPTIRKALTFARDLHDVNALGKVISHPGRSTWPKSNANAVAQFFEDPSVTMKAAVSHFGKSEPTIRKARKLAEQNSQADGSS